MSGTKSKGTWFPRDESVAYGILGYVCERPGAFTLEDIVFQLGCGASTAVAGVYILRRWGYIARVTVDDRFKTEKNPRWTRVHLRPTAKGINAHAKREQEILKRESDVKTG